MKPRIRMAVAAVVVVTLGTFSVGQEAPPTPAPDVVVDLNDGIHQYLQGHLDTRAFGYYKAAVERFTSVLERDPDNRTALLFRALSNGRVGLLERENRLRSQNRIESAQTILDILDDPDGQAEITRKIEALNARLEDDTLSPPQRVLLNTERDRLEQLQIELEEAAKTPPERTQADIESYRREMQTAARREWSAYTAMIDDIDRLNALLADTEIAVGLLDVVARSKIARLDDDEARDVKAGVLSPDEASDTVERLRARAEEALAQTAETLEGLLRLDLRGQDAIRAKFFLGVIRYRQAVPRRAPEEDVDIDEVRLAEAARIMRELSNDATAPDQWRSYASLYLGLILPIEALLETIEDEVAQASGQ